jgi:hypothetical protein
LRRKDVKAPVLGNSRQNLDNERDKNFARVRGFTAEIAILNLRVKKVDAAKVAASTFLLLQGFYGYP